MNKQKKKLPYFIGMGMIVAGIITMVVSNSVGEGIRQFIIFGGVMIFILGFAGTVIYATVKDTQGGSGKKKEKKPLTRAKIQFIASGIVCLAGFLALLAGLIVFGDAVNYLLVLLGMIAFLGGGSAVISIFTKNMAEFVPKEDGAGETSGENTDKDGENED